MLESQKNVSIEGDDRKERTDDISSTFKMIKELCNYSADKKVQI